MAARVGRIFSLLRDLIAVVWCSDHENDRASLLLGMVTVTNAHHGAIPCRAGWVAHSPACPTQPFAPRLVDGRVPTSRAAVARNPLALTRPRGVMLESRYHATDVNRAKRNVAKGHGVMAASVAVLKLLRWCRRVPLPPSVRRAHARRSALPPVVAAPHEGEDDDPG